MGGVVSGAFVSMPVMVQDVDYSFDYYFFDGNLDTQHNFLPDDEFSLVAVSQTANYPSIIWLSSDAESPISFVGNNVSVRLLADAAKEISTGSYRHELRRFGSDGSTDLLTFGPLPVATGLSLLSRGPVTNGLLYAPTLSEVSVLIKNAEVSVVYPVGSPSASLGVLKPQAAPVGNPTEGIYLWFDSTSRKLTLRDEDGNEQEWDLT